MLSRRSRIPPWPFSQLPRSVVFLLDPLGFRESLEDVGRDPRDSLLFSVPDPWAGSGGPKSLLGFDADRMNSLGDGVRAGLTYVSADQPSTGPGVVSVHPIDAFTWAAAARSRQGVCFVIALTLQGTSGGIAYGRLADHEECLGRSATPATASKRDWPDVVGPDS